MIFFQREIVLNTSLISGTVWYSMVWYGIVCYGMVCYSMVWFGTIFTIMYIVVFPMHPRYVRDNISREKSIQVNLTHFSASRVGC